MEAGHVKETGKPTTVGEIIDRLSAYPRDTRVLVRGYEMGWDDPFEKTPLHCWVIPTGIESSVCGDYETVMTPVADPPDGRFVAVVIDRPDR